MYSINKVSSHTPCSHNNHHCHYAHYPFIFRFNHHRINQYYKVRVNTWISRHHHRMFNLKSQFKFSFHYHYHFHFHFRSFVK